MLVEVIAASVILTITSVFLLGTLSHYLSSSQVSQSREVLLDVEKGIRSEVFTAVQQFYFDASHSATSTSTSCNNVSPSFNSRVYTTSPSGLTYAPVGPNAANILASLGKSEAYGQISTVITRCQSAPDTASNTSYFQNQAGIYFCVWITPSATTAASANTSLSSMQPLIGEFFFTNQNAESGNEVPCPKLLLPQPILGVMYYAFHWVPRGSQVAKSYIGSMAMANTSASGINPFPQGCSIILPDNTCIHHPQFKAKKGQDFFPDPRTGGAPSLVSPIPPEPVAACQQRATDWSYWCGSGRPIPTDPNGNPLLVQSVYVDTSNNVSFLTASVCAIHLPNSTCANSPRHSQALFMDYSIPSFPALPFPYATTPGKAQIDTTGATCQQDATRWSWWCSYLKPAPLDTSGNPIPTTGVYFDTYGNPNPLQASSCLIQPPGGQCANSSKYSMTAFVDNTYPANNDAAFCLQRTTDWLYLCQERRSVTMQAGSAKGGPAEVPTGMVSATFTDGSAVGSPAIVKTVSPTYCIIQLPTGTCPHDTKYSLSDFFDTSYDSVADLSGALCTHRAQAIWPQYCSAAPPTTKPPLSAGTPWFARGQITP